MQKAKVFLNGEKWLLKFCRTPSGIYGDCNYQTNEVRVSSRLVGQDKLDVLLHELIHARWPDLNEESVCEFASELAGICHAVGFREEWEFL